MSSADEDRIYPCSELHQFQQRRGRILATRKAIVVAVRVGEIVRNVNSTAANPVYHHSRGVGKVDYDRVQESEQMTIVFCNFDRHRVTTRRVKRGPGMG